MKMIYLALFLYVFVSAYIFAEDFSNVQFVRLYDGDTIYVDIAGLPALFGDDIPIRLARADTPEIRGACKREKELAYKAKAYVSSLLENAQTIQLTNTKRGKYFRIIAEVIADGVNISDKLLEKNYAVPYYGGKKHHWC